MQTMIHQHRVLAGPSAPIRRHQVTKCAAHPSRSDVVPLTAAIATLVSSAPSVQAGELFNSAVTADTGALTFAVGSGAAIAGLGALLVATDPQNRWICGCDADLTHHWIHTRARTRGRCLAGGPSSSRRQEATSWKRWVDLSVEACWSIPKEARRVPGPAGEELLQHDRL